MYVKITMTNGMKIISLQELIQSAYPNMISFELRENLLTEKQAQESFEQQWRITYD